MDGRNPRELLQALKYFEIDNPYYYECPVFRGPVLKMIFLKLVKGKIGGVLRIPYGLREDDPQVDDISDQTFNDVEKKLDGERVATLTTALARYALCYAFIMTVATRNAITHQRKDPYVYEHGDLEDDLRGHEAVTHAAYKSFEDNSEEEDEEERYKQRLFEVLSPILSEEDIGLIWLRLAEGLDFRDLSKEFKKSIGALRVRFHRRWPIAKEILSDPTVQRYLTGEDNAKHD